MGPRLISGNALPPTRWANGGGMTREIIVEPGPDGRWAWRLSLALCEKPGPFSPFPGIDRLFMLASGEIALNGLATFPKVIIASDTAAAFPGEAPVYAEPIGGPALALNLMVRRDRARATMSRHAGGTLPAPATFIFAPAPLRVRLNDAIYDLAPHDTLLLPDEPAHTPVHTDSPCIWARVMVEGRIDGR